MTIAAVIAAAACGRIGFESIGAVTTDGGDGDGDGSTGGPANRIFVTSTRITGGFGGLTGADGLCQDLATAATLDGTFIALLSSDATSARDRLAGSAGWVRVDGLPVASTANDWMMANAMLNPISLDENGAVVPVGDDVWTGTNIDGVGGLRDCLDWTIASNSELGVIGNPLSSVGQGFESGLPSCDVPARLYCAQVGRVATVSPASADGRLAFITSSTRTGTGGRDELDAMCQGEAEVAGLAGTFLAAVATTTASIASRFPDDGRPWMRVDGTRVAGATELFGGSLASFVNQDASGLYYTTTRVTWTGATSPTVVGTATSTCNNWLGTAGNGSMGFSGIADPALFWNGGTWACDNAFGRVLCLEL